MRATAFDARKKRKADSAKAKKWQDNNPGKAQACRKVE